MNEITLQKDNKYFFVDEIDSLIEFLQTSKLSCDKIFLYLYNYFDSQKFQEFLINKLSKFPNSSIDFFLPQLWLKD